jgi:hypothetical protein
MDTVQLKTHADGRKQSTVAFVRALVNAEAMTARSSSGRRFSGSWPVSPSNAKGLWRSTARFMTAECARCCRPVPSGYAAALSSLAMNSRRRHLDRSPSTSEPYHNDSMRCGRLSAQPKSSSITLRSMRPGKSLASMLGEAECASGKPGERRRHSDIHAAPGPYLTSTPLPLRPFLRRALRRECWPWRSCLRGRHIRRWAGRSCASEQQR